MMTNAPDAYGVISEPMSVTIQRLLPGPIERVWEFLTKSELRRQWLAAGDMPMEVDAPFELVWRNDELTDPPGTRPPGFSEEHRLQSRVLECEKPTRLAFQWDAKSRVTFDLLPKGKDVLLTVTHHHLSERPMLLGVSAGWHAHLDILAGKLSGAKPGPFWDTWAALKEEYEVRIPV